MSSTTEVKIHDTNLNEVLGKAEAAIKAMESVPRPQRKEVCCNMILLL